MNLNRAKHWNDFCATSGAACLSGNGNLWNGKGMFKVSLYLSTSGEIRSISRQPNVPRRQPLLPLDKAGEIDQLGGRKQAYAAEQLPPSANKRSPITQLGSHAEKNKEGGGFFHGERLEERTGSLLWESHTLMSLRRQAWRQGKQWWVEEARAVPHTEQPVYVFSITSLELLYELKAAWESK